MEEKNITSYYTFKLSIVASVISVVLVSFWGKLWSEYWLLSFGVAFPVFVFFIIAVIKSLGFSSSKRGKVKLADLPLLINAAAILAIFFLPLNWYRNYIEFKVMQTEMEKVVQMVEDGQLKSNVYHDIRLIQLPNKLSHLSTGGGQVIVEKIRDKNTIFFYTFRGTPDGSGGFMYVPQEIKFEELEKNIYYDLIEKRDLGDNWYYIFTD